MSVWPSLKPRALYAALLKNGWRPKHPATGGSHVVMVKDGWPAYTWSFHESREIGHRMVAKVAKQTGLTPDDL